MAGQKSIDEVISGLNARNASLRQVFLDKGVDLTGSRKIDSHFWTWSREDAIELGNSLKKLGFENASERSAGCPDDPTRWSLEASVEQSMDRTLRLEFTDEIARLAECHRGIYDGWGTLI